MWMRAVKVFTKWPKKSGFLTVYILSLKTLPALSQGFPIVQMRGVERLFTGGSFTAILFRKPPNSD